MGVYTIMAVSVIFQENGIRGYYHDDMVSGTVILLSSLILLAGMEGKEKIT